MTGMAYSWKPKACISIDPQAAGEHLEMLREKLGGELKPEAVVSDARHNNSPLHQAFEWDDSAAAEKFRLTQARHLIGSLVVTVKMEERPEPVAMRAFVSVTRDEKPHYTSLAVAMSDRELRAQVVEKAWRELISWREKYGQYKELARICAAIDAQAPQKPE